MMNTKSDWQTASRELMEQRRRELGGPPTVEEMLAYTRGELSQEDEERVRELLVCYPDLARGLTEPFPDEEAKPGEPGYVPEEVLARRWTALQSRVQAPGDGPRLLWFRGMPAAIAASLLLLVGAVLWRAQTHIGEPRIVGAREKLAMQPQLLEQEGRRGIGSTEEAVPAGKPALLLLPLIQEHEFTKYRVAILSSEANPATSPLWKSNPLSLEDENAITVLIPGDYLQPGRYRVAVYGIGDRNDRLLARYAIRVR